MERHRGGLDEGFVICCWGLQKNASCSAEALGNTVGLALAHSTVRFDVMAPVCLATGLDARRTHSSSWSRQAERGTWKARVEIPAEIMVGAWTMRDLSSTAMAHALYVLASRPFASPFKLRTGANGRLHTEQIDQLGSKYC